MSAVRVRRPGRYERRHGADRNGQTVSTNEDTALPITLTATDAENCELTFSIVSGPTNDRRAASPTMSVSPVLRTQTAQRDLHAGRQLLRHRRFTYTIGDGNGGTDTATVTITVTTVNDDPVADRRRGDGGRGQRRPTRSTCWPTTTTAPTRRDADGDRGHPGHGNGAVDLNADGRHLHAGRQLLRHRHLHLHDQRRQRRQRHRDGDGDGDQRQRRPGCGQRRRRTVAEDSGANAIDVLANDTRRRHRRDADGDRGRPSGANGDGDLHADGTGAPTRRTPNFIGTDSFTYTISDGNGGTDTATVTVTVTNVNDDPDRRTTTPATVAEDSGGNRSTCWPTTATAPDAGETLTVTAVDPGRERRRWPSRRRRRDATRRTPTSSAPTPSPTRSATATAARDTATVTRHGDPVNDDPVADRRRGDGGRGQRRPTRSTCWPTTPTARTPARR